MSTNYYRQSNKRRYSLTDNDTPIPIAASEFEDSDIVKDYFCNKCQCKLSILNEKTREYVCSRCNASYYPEHQYQEVRSKSRLTTPEGYNSTDRDIAVSYGIDPNEEFLRGKQQELKGGFAALAKKGTIRFTSYRTTEKE